MKQTKSLVWLLCLIWSTSAFSQVKWYNPLSFGDNIVHGRGWNNDNYNRLPPSAKEVVRDKVWSLSTESAGLYLVFKTNATDIQIKYKVSGGYSMPHMPNTGVSGLDLYALNSSEPYWCKGDFAFNGDTIRYNYQNLIINEQTGENTFELFLPLYNSVKHLEIGIDHNASFEFIESTNNKPIIAYGTSITQGACASRPGMAWTNILIRKLNEPLINLGFSGNGQLEPELFNLMSEIEAKLFIIDCMPNMTEERTELIYDRVISGVNILRKTSTAPILLVEHDGYMGFNMNKKLESNYVKTNIELHKAYKKLLKDGVKNIFYLSHSELNLSPDSQVDGTHASDLGMQEYATAYEKKIRKILKLRK